MNESKDDRFKKSIRICLSVIAFSWFLVSCSNDSNPTETEVKPTSNPDNDCTMLIASSEPVEGDYRIELELRGDIGECLPPEGRVVATIYGYDEFVADAPATVLKQFDVPTLAAGEIYEFGFDRSDLDKIEFQSGVTDELGFYIVPHVNIDGLGEICNGDYRQDFEVTEPTLFNAATFVHPLEMHLTEIDNQPCE